MEASSMGTSAGEKRKRRGAGKIIEPRAVARKTAPSGSQTQASRAVGRPRTGKRSNPEYGQVSAWIRKDTYRAVQDRLFPERREFSDLVQALLEKWLNSSPTMRPRTRK
jgi:hypothetical protein